MILPPILCYIMISIMKGMEGELETIMAGLNCGTPSEHGWRILKGSSDAFLSCDDRITVIGMRKNSAFVCAFSAQIWLKLALSSF